MGNTSWRSTSIATAPHEWRRMFHRGWVDVQNCQRWSAEYETMSKSEQIAYEQGRMLAREAHAEGFAFPVWRGDKATARPVDMLWQLVSAKLGRRVVPEEWKAAA